MTRILVCSTACSQKTGYARVSYVLLNDLARRGHDVHHFAFQNYYGPDDTDDYPFAVIDAVEESGTDFGYGILAQRVRELRPEVLIVYNDMVVTANVINALLGVPKTFLFLSYLDLVYEYQDCTLIKHIDRYVDHIFVLSECWIYSLERMAVPRHKLDAFPHGVDPRIACMPKREARRELGLGQDDFLVLNTNRNSYRKANDVTIAAFLQFWLRIGCPARVKLVLNCLMDIQTDGYDVLQVIQIECLRLGLDFAAVSSGTVLRMPGLLSESQINALYSACDVGINTCLGEGFGLCNLEHASLGRPQIVSDVGGLSDIFRDHCIRVAPAATLRVAQNIDTHSGDLGIPCAARFADALAAYYADPARRARDGAAVRAHVLRAYHWPTLLDAFHDRLTSLLCRTRQPQPPVYWITQSHRTDRHGHMLGVLPEGSTKILAQPAATPELSCMRAHYEAIRAAYADGRAEAMIVEDDVAAIPQVPWDVTCALPLDWEVLQLHYVNPILLEAIGELRPPQTLALGYFMGCSCYVINRRGMERFLDAMGRDHLTAQILETGRAEELVYRYVTTYCTLYPLTNTEETFGSDIPGSANNARNAELVAGLTIPSTIAVDVLRVPVHDHWHDCPVAARDLLSQNNNNKYR